MKSMLAIAIALFSVNSFAAVTSGTADLVYAHDHFSMVKIFDVPAQQMYQNLKTPVERDPRYPINSKKSEDGRLVCQEVEGNQKTSYECWIAFDSSNGSIIQTWLKK